MFLIDDLLFLPAKGFIAIVRKIRDMAAEELEDTPEKLQRELFDLQMMLDSGEISAQEHQKKEENILQRLNALKGIS
jgi:ribosomal protein L29